MSTPPERLPKLTEVVELPTADAGSVAARLAANRAAHETPGSPEQLVEQVLGDVQRQVDLMLEHRLREALTPALARLTDALVREARAELALSLRDLVTRAVAQEMSRHRPR